MDNLSKSKMRPLIQVISPSASTLVVAECRSGLAIIQKVNDNDLDAQPLIRTSSGLRGLRNPLINLLFGPSLIILLQQMLNMDILLMRPLLELFVCSEDMSLELAMI